MRLVLGIGLGSFLCSAAALAAGPFDGTWQGEVPGMGRQCPANTVTATVVDGKLTGTYDAARFTFHIGGTVRPDGTLVKGVMGTDPLAGKFTGNEFTGTYTSKGCSSPRQVTLHRAG
jgi:hypothetical protein